MIVDIVAEIGCNHQGSMRKAHKMIREAKKAGCDYVKFQYYDTEEIIAFEKANPPSLYSEELYQAIRKTELSVQDLAKIKDWCEKYNIGFICTPFINPEHVAVLAPFIDQFKIRARDAHNTELLDAAFATGKNVYVSTNSLPVNAHYLYHPQVDWLYTIPKYPATMDQFELNRIMAFDGFSNHIPGVAAPLAAVAVAKATGMPRFMLEVHVVLQKKKKYIDHAVSLDFKEVKFMNEQIRLIQQCQIVQQY